MAIEKTLSALKREGAGKGVAHRLRAKNLIPGVFYNAKGDNINVAVPALPLEQLYFSIGSSVVFNLEIDDNGKKEVYPVFFWDVQKHPYKKAFKHIDFYGVDLDKEVKVEVPLEFVGTAKGVKLGGLLETYRDAILVAAKPLEMPSKITVDVSDLDINKSITIAELPMPAASRAIFDTNFPLVTVLEKESEEEATEGEAAPATDAAAAPAAK